MSQQFFSVLIFMWGVIFGAIIAAFLQRKLDERRINQALDGPGIRRNEFLKLSGSVDSAFRAISVMTDRLAHLEKTTKDKGR